MSYFRQYISCVKVYGPPCDWCEAEHKLKQGHVCDKEKHLHGTQLPSTEQALTWS